MAEIQHRTKECAYCGHPYIQPCSTKADAAKCANIKVKPKKEK